MTHMVTIQRQSLSQDAIGQQVRTWTNLGNSWASVSPISGREYFAASGERAEVTHEVSIRARSDFSILPSDRLAFGSRRFQIKSVLNTDERNREFVLLCVETVSTEE